MAAQIAADLFRMKAELERHLANHNDLHADNIIVQRLSKGMYRQGAMDPSIRAVAIDLGSVGPDRRSGGIYRGDLHWIARHIQAMVDRLLTDFDGVSDLDSACSSCAAAYCADHLASCRKPADAHSGRFRPIDRGGVFQNC